VSPKTGPPLRVVTPDATPEEVAAIVAAVAAIARQRELAPPPDPAGRAETAASGQLDAWVRASRLTARRRGLTRGEWRLSGRVARRARA
jgi:hypothetical protein